MPREESGGGDCPPSPGPRRRPPGSGHGPLRALGLWARPRPRVHRRRVPRVRVHCILLTPHRAAVTTPSCTRGLRHVSWGEGCLGRVSSAAPSTGVPARKAGGVPRGGAKLAQGPASGSRSGTASASGFLGPTAKPQVRPRAGGGFAFPAVRREASFLPVAPGPQLFSLCVFVKRCRWGSASCDAVLMVLPTPARQGPRPRLLSGFGAPAALTPAASHLTNMFLSSVAITAFFP